MAPIIPLWILFLVVVAIFALCLRAVRVERAEGLAPSTRRLAAAGATALVLGVIAVVASTLSAEPPAQAPNRENDPKMAAQKAKLDAKEARLAELRKEADGIQTEVDVLLQELGKKPVGPSRLELEQRRAERQLLALEIAFLVMLLGLGAMFLLGDPRTLFLKRKKSAEEGATDPIDAMARAAQAGRFEEALRAAATVEEAKLEGLELIDFLYMRGIAQIQHAHQAGTLLRPKKQLFEDAVKDLARVVVFAPNMGEAHYALGTAHFGNGAYADGAEAFARAGELTASTNNGPNALPITKARSACLVRDGERRLAEADADGAKRCFDEVMALGVFTKEIPAALMSHRLASVLGDLRSGKLDEARAGIALVREARAQGGLDAERQRLADVTCAVYEMLLWHKSDEHAQIVAKLPALLQSWEPKNLPVADEQAADEYLFAPIESEKLDPPAEVFRALYLLLAVAEARVITKVSGRSPGAPLTADEVQRIARPLYRALQFEPRHREALAALGVLFYLCRPDARDKAVEWLDASVAMGTSSKVARRLLELDRGRETARKALLDEFRGAASRFLGDSMVDPKVRAALLEELGRFQDFRPVLVDLDNQAEIGHEAPTLAALKERVSYIQDVATTAEGRMPPDATRALRAIRDEYDTLVATIEHGATRVSSSSGGSWKRSGRWCYVDRPHERRSRDESRSACASADLRRAARTRRCAPS